MHPGRGHKIRGGSIVVPIIKNDKADEGTYESCSDKDGTQSFETVIESPRFIPVMSSQIALWATWNATSSNDYSQQDEANNLFLSEPESRDSIIQNLPQ
jgi:hypothetical protein